MTVKFCEKTLQKAIEIKSHYPTPEASLLMILHLANDEFGYLNDDVYSYLSEFTSIHKSKIYSAPTFYSMYNQKPVGRYHIQICKNVPCMLSGADNLIEYIEKKLNIKPGETTADKKFTLSAVECLGCCGNAPVMMINYDFHINLTAAKIDSILDGLK